MDANRTGNSFRRNRYDCWASPSRAMRKNETWFNEGKSSNRNQRFSSWLIQLEDIEHNDRQDELRIVVVNVRIEWDTCRLLWLYLFKEKISPFVCSFSSEYLEKKRLYNQGQIFVWVENRNKGRKCKVWEREKNTDKLFSISRPIRTFSRRIRISNFTEYWQKFTKKKKTQRSFLGNHPSFTWHFLQ